MKKFNLLKKISAFIFFFITLISIFIISFLIFELKSIPDINKENLSDSITSRIYDKDNNLVATIGNERREFIDYNDIPKSVVDAVLSVEDSRFESHIGLDPKRIIKALIVNVSAGASLEGGSTITQQVIKTSLLTSKKTYDRKIQEALLSLELEAKYTKEDILEMYLNKIFYSDNQYGIKSASKYFYNKDLSELTLPQVALLAGLPQQPTYYNPYDNMDAAKNRRDTVLYAMYNNNKITAEEYNEYINVPIDDGLVLRNKEERMLSSISNSKYGAYIDFVVKEVKNLPVFSDEKDPFSLGLNIYTNLDGDLQEHVQNMLDTEAYPYVPHASQSAITILDTKTGLLKSIGGGKNYKYGGFNYALDSKLQPGSAIKPIFDYAPGIEYYGWDSLTTFLDTPYLISGTNHYIQNWDRLYHGNVTMRKALAMSYNIPAVRAFERLGYERSKHFANKLGIDLTTGAPTAAIGGNVDTVSPVQLAGAFAAFGNKGYYNKPSSLIKIVDRSGNEVSNIKEFPKKAMNESTAFIITDMLKDVLSYSGTSPLAAVPGYDIAAKSGSTTFDEKLALFYNIDVINATKDSWLVGYTTDNTVAVWQGADSVDSAEKALSTINTQATQRIFAHIMKIAHGDKIPEKFSVPNTVELLGGVYYPKDRSLDTDHMYVGTELDSVYQAKKSEKIRENRMLLSVTNIRERILPDKKSNETIMNNNNTNNNTNNKVNNTGVVSRRNN
ncbi:transglycosylase domain-containing protein [Gemelliphila palaticanis]|uniref:PBP1A family penicillin-binding protein n=1 Tax=Gemelliphila palaticanis TaxID=81950 RepID=A0ABX2SZZ1_9BACL|nr:PBP1A family penicillin-binding protein [Gemella palaticanis]MBF0714779.1 PBP1A family penicillin-binding protein [Gemella palaticanis]NYS46709.1 PBP1A family penicillin-binding protein [Gemella palaticanis]